jgi:hypothetical protein
VAVIATVVLVACTRAEDDGPKELVPIDSVAGAPAIDPRDQYALLAEIESALGDSIERNASSMAKVRSGWVGKRFRWEVGLVPVFCRSYDRCNVAPFDHGIRPDRRIRQGFMPQLALDEAGFAAMQAACAGQPPGGTGCVLHIEATMGRFAFSPDEPTAIRFDDVELLGARAATADESWIVSKVRARGRS